MLDFDEKNQFNYELSFLIHNIFNIIVVAQWNVSTIKMDDNSSILYVIMHPFMKFHELSLLWTQEILFLNVSLVICIYNKWKCWWIVKVQITSVFCETNVHKTSKYIYIYI
jgi:hypothetical protein